MIAGDETLAFLREGYRFVGNRKVAARRRLRPLLSLRTAAAEGLARSIAVANFAGLSLDRQPADAQARRGWDEIEPNWRT